MNDKEDNKTGGFQLSRDGVNCLCCKFRKNIYHKETKTTTEKNKVIVNVVEDRSSFKIGKGRVETPDDGIFKPDTTHQIGSIEICDAAFGGHKVTPEQNEERIDKIETEIEEVNKDISDIKKNMLNSMDEYLKNKMYIYLTMYSKSQELKMSNIGKQ